MKNFQGMVSSVASLTPCYSLLLAHSLLDSSLCGHLEAAPAVCLHVSHPADGLDLGLVGSPLVPVLVRSHLKHVLEATVARVLVAHPAVKRRETDVKHKSLILPVFLSIKALLLLYLN